MSSNEELKTKIKQLELNKKLINKLSECIEMLSQEDAYDADYVINRYLFDIVDSNEYKIQKENK